jgi:hypothetical protein
MGPFIYLLAVHDSLKPAGTVHVFFDSAYRSTELWRGVVPVFSDSAYNLTALWVYSGIC